MHMSRAYDVSAREKAESWIKDELIASRCWFQFQLLARGDFLDRRGSWKVSIRDIAAQ